ncbi:MAG: IS110 family transposase [Acidobacteriota bacterium]
MVRHVGMDVHKKTAQVCILGEGAEEVQTRIPCTLEQIERFAKHRLRPEDEVVLEATTNTWAVVAILKRYVRKVTVSNPLLTRAIASAKIKTDKIDALVLARLLRSGYLPAVWEPDERAQGIRKEMSIHAALVADRTRLKNRIHSALAGRLIPVPVADLFSKKGREWLASAALPEGVRIEVDRWRRQPATPEEEIAAHDQLLAERAYQDDRVRLLMTLPGHDYPAALSLMSALGDISRFQNPDRAAGYLGLVPSTRASDDKVYHGPITKRGRSHARWMLVQAAQHVASHPGPLGHFFRRLAARKNRNVAVVATARKLVTVAWHMLRNNEPYRYAQSQPTQNKLSALRVRVTGVPRRTGPAKGQPKPACCGSGQPTRLRPALNAVYSSEGLPPSRTVNTLPAGERRLLQRTRLLLAPALPG